MLVVEKVTKILQHLYFALLGKWDEEDAFRYNPAIEGKVISTLPVFSIGFINLHEEAAVDLSVQTLEVNKCVF